ncbi:hypothetical protein LTR09_012373 [Extremus antarcticus]|uniref:Mediator of RNA polymerase II transcription subunit 5 n=1 Tax=Extremus antarcticus TaxID=702011 RepID=A0AAJ0DA17_9PEZI|nr:hypothetical protein LTR09_012373 [Extremus antarcticus]
MPYLDPSLPTNTSAQKWKTAIKHALLRRFSGDQLSKHVQELVSRYPITPDEVARILLSFRARDTIGADDCLIFQYAEVLLRAKAVSPTSILTALLKTSDWAKRPVADGPPKHGNGLPTCEERMFNVLTQMYISGALVFLPSEAHGLVFALTLWLQKISDYEMSKQMEKGALHIADAFSFGTYDAVASLAITVLGCQPFRDAAKHAWWQKRRDVVASEMQKFDTHVLLWMRSPLAGRLQALTTIPPFLKTDSKGRPLFTDEQVLGSITELPAQNSRAGLFIWLNACLCTRPLTDDLSMLTYLQARYPGNNQALAVDLLIAAFDALTNALLRKESNQQIPNIRSFICNKVPHLLSIAPLYIASGLPAEACISMAFMAITMDVLPPISTGATETREKLKVTRLEFLQACALHGLVSEHTIASILQEPAISLPRVTKYTKEGLLAQCSSNIGRLEPLMDELDGMLGNAGAISGCIVDTIANLCMGRDSISLKTVCNMLIKKPPCLDIILQYTRPANLLLPLCNQLDGWQHDQDQTEFTPAYEEFASILLLVLVAVHRYGLSRADLGLPGDDSFIARLLQDIAVSRSPSELTPEQMKQLARWIEGLYATDESEGMGGISDEVMRHCPPQAFYQLVPTLFHQTVLARKSGVLSVKTFHGGLELLVEPFLLPSLVGGLSWLVEHSWEDHQDADVLLQILEKLLKPSSSSQETKSMHKAILGIVANSLYESLKILHQRQPEKKQPGPLMNILKPHINQQKTVEANKAELQEWTSSSDGDLAKHVRNSIQEMVKWVTEVGPTPPPKYTHRLFAHGCATLGVDRMRDELAAELNDQTKLGNGTLALDICSAMICAPSSSSGNQSTSGVRESLRLKATDVQKLLHTGASAAQSLVRLNRRVEAQLAVVQMPPMAMALPMADPAADQVMADLGLTDDAAAVAAADTSLDVSGPLGPPPGDGFDNAALNAVMDEAMNINPGPAQDIIDLTAGGGTLPTDAQDIFADLNMDMTQDPQQMLSAGGNDGGMSMDGQQNQEEDIFAGLDMSLGDDGDDFVNF